MFVTYFLMCQKATVLYFLNYNHPGNNNFGKMWQGCRLKEFSNILKLANTIQQVRI